jgi:LysR family transcriptional regulator, low CO2-responsive transcriptional regulator
MDLRQLEILCAIAETGTFTGAGEKLHVSQSAISRQVLLLEDELREPLFIRQGRGAVPTHAGQMLIQLGRRLLDDLTATVGQIRDERDELRGALRIAGGMTVCLYVFPPLLKEFRHSHPRVDIKLITGATPRLVRQLRTGQADVALLTLPIEEPSFVIVPALREELMLVMPPEHPLAGRRRVAPKDLASEPFVLFEPNSVTRRTIDRLFTEIGIEPRVVLETENVEILKALVAIGMGLSIIPYQSVANEARAGQLACARIAGHVLERETGWVYPRSAHLPRAVQELIRTLDKIHGTLKLTPGPTPAASSSARG